MLEKKNFKHQQHYCLVKETGVSRRALNQSGRLDLKGYLLDSYRRRDQILDVSNMLDLKKTLRATGNFKSES
jgi:hypothetical protein